ncbi:hypothetical protein QE197_13100 [Arsenophonus nasoniae]|uniref:Phage transcriptional regulator n=1 Tax=Arsenophonus nasoniae TaxID=638 RepID=D2U206_9GAMM|nr:hypothetical protein [Arsenophonus nasoniae]QBY44419.1 hypothetical protein ArsFIN_30050 [Arsenophonus nasoniae]WGM04678.1 hypothetical protein QE258_13835 [Arsenophonus nasoniae]WGM09792.1 hypothetical protein QE197_13100 [Arsenophonus nasoniae]WGM14511.1 hypothetical protein QE193_13000 [Arsenophonus nasoniae]CBA74933.1 hypothetical protein ARN_26070 [Arsenophonus nasoniae]
MTPEQFIQTNVKAELMKLGFSNSVASLATSEAIRYYRKQPVSRRGKMLEDCLNQAKRWAKSATKHKH